MVSTRRQSGAASTVEGSKALANDADDSEMEEDLSELSSAEEEEEDYKSRGTRRKTATVPKAKRQKVTKAVDPEPEAASVVAKATKRRRGKDLSLLVTMPLDILFEILSLLSPKDLLSVSQTNKLFHQTLAAPNAKSVWITARGPSGAPEPPRDVTEARWAALLFRSTCQLRHTSAIHPHHSFPGWHTRELTFRIATAEERDKAQGANCALEERLVWRCDRCPSAVSFQSQKGGVMNHLRIAHNITAPDMSKDCFLDEPARWAIHPYECDARPPAAPKHAKATNYQCMQCTEPSTAKRRFIEMGVLSHISAKHKIADPKINVHYKVDPKIFVPNAP